MSPNQIKNVGARYQVRFGNVDEIAHPSILFTPRFGRLLARALRTGIALTPATVEAAFPGIGWEE